MATSYEQLIAELHTRHDYAQSHLGLARIALNTAEMKWNAGNDHGAIASLITAAFENNQASEDIIWKSYYGYNGATNIIPTALDLLEPCEPSEPYELTMSKILEAMLEAEPHQPLLFIAYVEAYRASVWNATFDERFFADLVKKWAIWG